MVDGVMNATNTNIMMLSRKRLNSNNARARYGAKIRTSGITDPSNLFMYPPEEAIVTAVVVL
jgi:hypothetical protein